MSLYVQLPQPQQRLFSAKASGYLRDRLLENYRGTGDPTKLERCISFNQQPPIDAGEHQRECNQKREGTEKLGFGLGTWGPRISDQRHRFNRPTTSLKGGVDKPSCLHPADACRSSRTALQRGSGVQYSTLPAVNLGGASAALPQRLADGRTLCACASPWV